MNIEPLSWEEYAARPGVSNSMLKYCSFPYFPAHYRARYITGELKDEDTPAKRMGRLNHRLCLEPDSMDGAFHVRPEGMKFTTKDGIAWRDSHQDRLILTHDEAQEAICMRDSVWRHPTARALLKGAATEVSIFATDADGMQRKGRLDALPPSGNTIPDLKFVASIAEDDLEKAIFEYRWFVASPYYLDLLKLAGDSRSVFAFIFVEKTPPYLVTVRPLSEDIEAIGRRVYRADLARLKHCQDTNTWPGDPNDGQDISIPHWAAQKFQQSIE